MQRSRNIWIALLASAAILTGCSQESQPLSMNPYFSKDSGSNSGINMRQVQESYGQSLANNYRAILGSSSTREMAIRNLTRLLMVVSSGIAPDTLQQHFTSFGYFTRPSKTGIQEYCRSRDKFVGSIFVFPVTNPSNESPCGANSRLTAVLIGYSPRVFFVPRSNRFAESISVSALVRAMQKSGGALWSDLNKNWPKRRIRWVFSSQEDFVSEFKLLAIKPPAHFQLAASYDSAFMNLSNHPDNLLIAAINTGLNAKLQGALFRALSIESSGGSRPVSLSADTIQSYPPRLVKGVYIYYDKNQPQYCIAASLAAYLVKNNKSVMAEDGLIPLPSGQQAATMNALRKEFEMFNGDQNALPLCKAYSEFLKTGG